MPLQAIEPRRLYRQIAEQLRGLIQRGEYAVGQRLPGERELAQRLGVSRPSVREALIALEVEGLVEVRVGSGVLVLAQRAPAASRSVGNAYGPFEIMRARQVLEGELAALAARQMNRAQVAGLRAALTGMEADIARGTMPIAADRQFHLLIAEAADNMPLLRALEQLYDERNNPLFEQFGHRFENVHTWRKALAEHQAVADAIAARNPDTARQQMQRHLQRSQSRYAAMSLAPKAPLAVAAAAPRATPAGRSAPLSQPSPPSPPSPPPSPPLAPAARAPRTLPATRRRAEPAAARR